MGCHFFPPKFALPQHFMGERKPSCHYIPPDFDPSKAPRRCKPQNGQHQVRFMLPMSIQCSSCGDYMFQGTKCNCRKELCYDDFYLGINVYRIYLHCKSCYAEITIKTDPKNCDYILEQGATRQSEPWREHELARALEMKRQLAGNPIETAEEKAVDNQRDMDQKREIGRLSAVSAKQNAMNLHDVKVEASETPSNLTASDRDKIERFEEMKIRDSPSTVSSALPSVNAVWTAPPPQRKGLLSYDTSDED